MVEGGEGRGEGYHPAPRGGGGAAGRRNREVTFNPYGAGREGTRGLGEERGALGRLKAPLRSRAGGVAGDPQGSMERRGEVFSFSFSRIKLRFNLAVGTGLFAVLDEADVEFGCAKKKCSEAVVLNGRGGSVQNLLRGPDSAQLAYFEV